MSRLMFRRSWQPRESCPDSLCPSSCEERSWLRSCTPSALHSVVVFQQISCISASKCLQNSSVIQNNSATCCKSLIKIQKISDTTNFLKLFLIPNWGKWWSFAGWFVWMKIIFILYNFGMYKKKIVTNSKQKCAIPY